MVIYDLTCEIGHQFEGWFRDSDELLEQQAQAVLRCPYCDSPQVSKRLTAAKLTKKTNASKSSAQEVVISGQSPQQYAELQKMLRKVHEFVDEHYEDVGNRFAEQAIGIHRGEQDPVNIRGVANSEQLAQLREEGVDALPLPPRPIDKAKLN